MTSHGKRYTNAFPLNDLKRWQSVGKALAKRWIPVGYPLGTRWVPVGNPLGSRWKCWKKRWKCWENPLEVLRKAVEKLCAEQLKNPLGKFTQAMLGVESKE